MGAPLVELAPVWLSSCYAMPCSQRREGNSAKRPTFESGYLPQSGISKYPFSIGGRWQNSLPERCCISSFIQHMCNYKLTSSSRIAFLLFKDSPRKLPGALPLPASDQPAVRTDSGCCSGEPGIRLDSSCYQRKGRRL